MTQETQNPKKQDFFAESNCILGSIVPNPAIQSAQHTVHNDLDAVVMRHAAHPFRKPIAAHTQAAFEHMVQAWGAHGYAPLIIDAGCGVGESTWHLALAHPEAFVVGVDQSEVRLSTQKNWGPHDAPCNALWLRADLVDFWRLLASHLQAQQRTLYKHYVLYPNPYPKIGQLHKRWHGHAVFPTVVALGGILEVRSNWGIYVHECAQAVTLLTGALPKRLGQFEPTSAITPFERKYAQRQEPLFVCQFELVNLAAERPNVQCNVSATHKPNKN